MLTYYIYFGNFINLALVCKLFEFLQPYLREIPILEFPIFGRLILFLLCTFYVNLIYLAVTIYKFKILVAPFGGYPPF